MQMEEEIRKLSNQEIKTSVVNVDRDFRFSSSAALFKDNGLAYFKRGTNKPYLDRLLIK